jgi:hypothetical protein
MDVDAAWEADEQETEGQGAEPKLYFESLPAFMEHLAVLYRRKIDTAGTGGGTLWCPQWWRHPEAVSRLEALWRVWENLRLDGQTGMSVWWRDHADPHMARLMSTDGPFQGCTLEDGHKPKVRDLPLEPPPDGLFG